MLVSHDLRSPLTGIVAAVGALRSRALQLSDDDREELLETIDLDAFRAAIRDTVNKRVGATLVHEVLIDQVNFLSKDEIRDNWLRRKKSETASEMTKPFK